MNILPGYSYLIVIAAFFQGFLVLLVIFLFLERFINFRKRKVEEALIREEAHKQAQQILDAANSDSYKTIRDAQEKANVIISHANIAVEVTQKQMDSSMQNLIKLHSEAINKNLADFMSHFENALARKEITTLASFDQTFDKINSEIVSQVKSYKDVMQKNSLDMENTLRTNLENDLTQIRTKLGEYEAVKMKNLNDKIFQILTKVSHDALRKTFTISDHEDLVIQSLEQAKIEGKFQL
jgi:hypothetical protein